MNWKLLFSLTNFGLLLGIISIFGFSAEFAPWTYAVGGIFCSMMIAKNTQNRLVLHAVLLGLMIGSLEAVLCQFFESTYLDNNPALAEAYMWSFGLFFVANGLLMGTLYAGALAMTSWLASKVLINRPAQVKSA